VISDFFRTVTRFQKMFHQLQFPNHGFPRPSHSYVNELGSLIRDWLFPRRCLFCLRPSGIHPVCGGCERDYLPAADRCHLCAITLPGAPKPSPATDRPSVDLCGVCIAKGYPAAATFCLAEYDWPLSAVIGQGKYGGRRDCLHALGDLLANQVIQRTRDLGRGLPEAIVPVPLHPHRLRDRGYNQAAEIARSISNSLGVRMSVDTLVRSRDTPSQTELSARQRQRNVRNAFKIAPGTQLPAHIALVDDVMTSGSTLAAAANACKSARVHTVEYWVIARASDPRVALTSPR
jgi:ComF family protein